MTEQGHTQDLYGRQPPERRQTALPSIACTSTEMSSLQSQPTFTDPSLDTYLAHYPHNSDSGDSQPSSATSMNYPHSGGLSPYDPVHDHTYGLPRISTSTSAAQSPTSYSPDGYSRGDRSLPTSYGAGSRYDLPARPSTALPPMEDPRRERHHYTPSHELETLSYRAPTQGLHSFRIQPGQGADQRNQAYASGVATASGGYPTLPPLTLPEVPGDDKGPAKRIVMACHQCRARKIRCDAERPSCGNCHRRREECRYDDKPKRRGPDKIPGSRMRSCKSKKQGMGSSGLPEASGSGSVSSGAYYTSDLPP